MICLGFPLKSVLFLLSQTLSARIGTHIRSLERDSFVISPIRQGVGKIGIALLTEKEIGLVSAVYTVFEVVSDKLIPEYLMLWFKRSEFDRYARYHSHGSVREIFDWEEMCNVELPVPPIEEQKAIVKAYETIERRIELKRKINDNLAA